MSSIARPIISRLLDKFTSAVAVWPSRFLNILVGMPLLLVMFLASPAISATINVTANATDTLNGADGQCSLREAISNINGWYTTYADCSPTGSYGVNDTINIPAGTYTGGAGTSEDLNATGDYDIRKSVSIVGAGPSSTIINGGLDRVFDINPAGTAGVAVSISDITITGSADSGDGFPSSIRNRATLTIANSTISGNMFGGIINDGVNGALTVTTSTISGNGGSRSATWGVSGIWNNGGVITVTNSTISGNGGRGGIYNSGILTITITNSTISDNLGSGIANYGGVITVTNSTISGNAGDPGYYAGGISNNSYYATATLSNTIVANQTSGGDCSGGAITSSGYNLSSDASCGFTGAGDLQNTNPMLVALADNGGPTQTMALLTGSPAIDAGSCVQSTDQRGTARPQGAGCDIGAYEGSVAGYMVTATAGTGGTVTPSSQGVISGSTASFTVTPNTGYTTSSTVGGTCAAGSWNGTTYTTGAVTATCSVSFSFGISYTVTATVGTGGTVTPASQTVFSGSTASFTVTANTGNSTNSAVVGTCPAGSWNGTTYTTGSVTSNCEVGFTFTALPKYTVSATAGTGGSVTPASRNVYQGSTTSFTVTANSGYVANSTVGGTCAAGSWSGTTYTTGAITAACSVSFTFTPSYVVAATASAGGAITPASQNVPGGSTATFTVTPNTGWTIVSVTGCGGGLNGNTYTTSIINGPCNISATFAGAPTVTTGAVGGISLTGTASVVGLVNANGASTTVTFEYGTTTAYGSTVTGTSTLTGYDAQSVTGALTGLTCGITYHYRATATNSVGTTNGADATFVACVSKTYGDFNGDGTTDILWRDTSTGKNAIWLMSGTTKLSGASLTTVATSWIVAGLGDFNGDGMADILWRDSSSGKNAIWLMNGATKTSGASLTTVNTSYSVAGVADFNGDGMADILWRDKSTGKNVMWFMNGTTKTSGGAIQIAATNYSVGGVADFNGDGMADILWRDKSSGKNAIWLMNGTTKTNGASLTTVSTSYSVAGLGDFNGDGMADILWRNTSGKNVVWFMNGTTKTSGSSLTTVSTSYSVVRVGDFNADGLADILWRDTNALAPSKNIIWLMNGATKTGGATTSLTGSNWKVKP